MSDSTANDQNQTSQVALYFHHAGLTDTGLLREHNEDDLSLPVGHNDDVLEGKGHLYVLADGMGGHQKGEVASAVTVATVPQAYYRLVPDLDPNTFEDDIVTALTEAIAEANVEVMKATEGGGTTVVAAVLYADLLVMINIGDSRAYLLRDHELKLISRDHSLVTRLVEMGKITEEDALTHPRRNVLYQALGQGPDLEPHIYSERVKPDDIIILCSDGLWGEIQDEQLGQVLNEADSPALAAKQLVALANEAGGPDNITAIIIQVSEEVPPRSQYDGPSQRTGDTRPVTPLHNN